MSLEQLEEKMTSLEVSVDGLTAAQEQFMARLEVLERELSTD